MLTSEPVFVNMSYRRVPGTSISIGPWEKTRRIKGIRVFPELSIIKGNETYHTNVSIELQTSNAKYLLGIADVSNKELSFFDTKLKEVSDLSQLLSAGETWSLIIEAKEEIPIIITSRTYVWMDILEAPVSHPGDFLSYTRDNWLPWVAIAGLLTIVTYIGNDLISFARSKKSVKSE